MNNNEIHVIIPLQDAKFCVQCEVIFNITKDGNCPVCGSTSTILLEKWINRK